MRPSTKPSMRSLPQKLWSLHFGPTTLKCCGIFCCSVKAFNSSNSYSAFKFSSSSWGLESKPWSWARTIFRWKPSNIYYKFWDAAPLLNSRFSKHSCSASQYNIAICMYIYIYVCWVYPITCNSGWWWIVKALVKNDDSCLLTVTGKGHTLLYIYVYNL